MGLARPFRPQEPLLVSVVKERLPPSAVTS
jgi:hypothetical protein